MATVRHLGLFPFCPQKGRINSDLYPVGISLERAMKWYWRVKSWNINVIFSFSETFEDNYTFPNNSVIADKNVTSSPDTEKNLVCRKFTSLENSDALATYRFELFAADPPMCYEGDIFYPAVRFSGEFFLEGGEITIETYNFDLSGNDPEEGAVWIEEILGSGVGIASRVRPTGGQGGMTALITIDKYWGYDPGDGGGPIYDENTGAQIRPFPA